MLGKVGVTELLLILAIVIVIFGPKQIPKLAQIFGQTIKGFKKGIEEGMGEADESRGEAPVRSGVENAEGSKD